MRFKAFKDFFKSMRAGKDDELDFRAKVEKILEEEKDFRSLYDCDILEKLNEKELESYMYSILKDYLKVKADLLNEKSIRKIG